MTLDITPSGQSCGASVRGVDLSIGPLIGFINVTLVQLFAEGVLGLAAAFRRGVIAEGVETAAEARMLRRLGCHYHQGFLYARPLPADEFDRGWAMPAARSAHR